MPKEELYDVLVIDGDDITVKYKGWFADTAVLWATIFNRRAEASGDSRRSKVRFVNNIAADTSTA